jgi:hypothetical protein
LAIHRHGFDISIAGKQEMRANRFEECRALLARIGPHQQILQRMRVVQRRALVNQEGGRGDALGHELDGAVHDGIADIAFARERRIVARRPAGMAAALQLHELRRPAGLDLRRPQQIKKAIKHLFGAPMIVRQPKAGPAAHARDGAGNQARKLNGASASRRSPCVQGTV